MTRPILPIFALCAALAACDENRARTPEGEADADPSVPDAGPAPDPDPDPDPDPGPGPRCAIDVGPLAACEPPAIPSPVCTVELTGDARFTVTLDGGHTALLDAAGTGKVTAFDAEGRLTLYQTVEGGCAITERATLYDAERTVDRRRTPAGSTCRIETLDDGRPVRTETDDGCDCADRVLTGTYAYALAGPLSCTDYAPDGGVRRARTWSYDAEGRVTREAVDDGADGVPDQVETTAYDARGRVIEKNFACRDCPVTGGVRRETWTYEDAAGRVTYRLDEGDDGRFELVEITTSVNGRTVLFESHSAEGDLRVETVYFDDGGREQTWTEDGEVVKTVTVNIDGRRRRATSTDPWQTEIEITEVDERGRLVSRSVTRSRGSDFVEEFTWDEDGRLITERVTGDTADGPQTCVVDYRWIGDCPGPHGRFNRPCGALSD